ISAFHSIKPRLRPGWNGGRHRAKCDAHFRSRVVEREAWGSQCPVSCGDAPNRGITEEVAVKLKPLGSARALACSLSRLAAMRRRKLRDGEAPAPTREAHALPRSAARPPPTHEQSFSRLQF